MKEFSVKKSNLGASTTVLLPLVVAVVMIIEGSSAYNVWDVLSTGEQGKDLRFTGVVRHMGQRLPSVDFEKWKGHDSSVRRMRQGNTLCWLY